MQEKLRVDDNGVGVGPAQPCQPVFERLEGLPRKGPYQFDIGTDLLFPERTLQLAAGLFAYVASFYELERPRIQCLKRDGLSHHEAAAHEYLSDLRHALRPV